MELREINVSFQELQEQARRLEETAADMKRLAGQQLERTIQEMAECWQGETASAYFKKAELVRQDIIQTAKGLDEAAEDIRAQARRLYSAEQQAVNLAQTDSSNH